MNLTLPDKPKSKELSAFQKAALERLGTGQPLSVNAGDVSQLPLAWIQMLVATSREAALRGSSVTIINPSFAFLFSFEALGLQPEQDLFTLEYGP
jgi:hypothetical protein